MIGYRKQLVIRDLAAGENDEVFAWCALPGGATLLRAWVSYFLATTTDLLMTQGWQYGMHGNILPVLDPDTLPSSPDDMWDKQVPKADPIGTTMGDLDTGSADTTIPSHWEHYNINNLMGQTTAPEQIFKRHKILTMASPGSVATTATQYRAMESNSFGLRKARKVRVPSIALLALSSYPTQGAEAGWSGVDAFMPDTKVGWNMLANPKFIMQKAMLYAQGLESEGTGTMSSDEALAEMLQWAEQVYNEAAGSIEQAASRIIAKVTWKVKFPKPWIPTLSSGD